MGSDVEKLRAAGDANALVALLRSPQKQEASKALQEWHPAEAVAPLLALLKLDRDRVIREELRRLQDAWRDEPLGSGRPSDAELLDHAQAGYYYIEITAYWVFRRAGGPEAAEGLSYLASYSADPEIRESAANALRE